MRPAEFSCYCAGRYRYASGCQARLVLGNGADYEYFTCNQRAYKGHHGLPDADCHTRFERDYCGRFTYILHEMVPAGICYIQGIKTVKHTEMELENNLTMIYFFIDNWKDWKGACYAGIWKSVFRNESRP